MSRRPDHWILVFLFLLVGAGVTPYVHAEQAPRAVNGLFPDEIVSAEELKKEMDGNSKPMLLDARNQVNFKQEHIPGAQMPRSEEYQRQEALFQNAMAPSAPDADAALVEWAQNIPKDRPIVTYCNSNCHLSAGLTLRLKQLGFKNVRSMEEGIQSWDKKGYPVVKQPL